MNLPVCELSIELQFDDEISIVLFCENLKHSQRLFHLVTLLRSSACSSECADNWSTGSPFAHETLPASLCDCLTNPRSRFEHLEPAWDLFPLGPPEALLVLLVR
jgi:hypothetical protein